MGFETSTWTAFSRRGESRRGTLSCGSPSASSASCTSPLRTLASPAPTSAHFSLPLFAANAANVHFARAACANLQKSSSVDFMMISKKCRWDFYLCL